MATMLAVQRQRRSSPLQLSVILKSSYMSSPSLMAAFAASKRGRFPASGWTGRKSYKKYPSGSNLCASNVCCIFIQSIFEGVIEVDHTPKSARLYEEKLLQQKQLLEKSMLSAVEQGRAATAEDTQDPADQAVFSYQKELLFSQGTTGHMQL